MLTAVLPPNREGVDSGVEGFPMRHWSIRVVGVHAETKQDVEADMFDKVTYNLHPSFNERAKQGQFHIFRKSHTEFRIFGSHLYGWQTAKLAQPTD